MHAHFDCFSGISGDMVLGAFVDMGVSCAWLTEQIGGLGLGGVQGGVPGGVKIVAREVKQNGIGATQIRVVETAPAPARNYRDILALLEKAALGQAIRKRALDIFGRIAEAEARIHRCPIDTVHFHEVGAVDSIVDIVGAALCLDFFKIESVSSSELPLGSGWVDCSHGKLPLPAPATVEILKGLPVYGGDVEGEWVTPTGAGIVAAVAREFGPIPPMQIQHIGYGSGSRQRSDRPNLLRVLVGHKKDPVAAVRSDDVSVVQTNIDDMNPEIFSFLMEKLFEAGALDVSLTALTMKKNRPGTKVEVLCPPDRRAVISAVLLRETSTLGVRYHTARREVLQRSIVMVTTDWGEVAVKCTTDPDGRKRYAPEYEACRKIALENNVPLKAVYDAVAGAVGGQ